MGCKNCKTKPVWVFTNKTQLCKNCFCDYIERKVFATIRKYQMLPENKKIYVKKDGFLSTNVLIYILKKKFKVNFSNKPNINSSTLSKSSEDIFSKILEGDFKNKDKILSPLYYISDKEIEIYSKIKGIRGKTREENKKIKGLFKRFSDKNKDLEHNIVNAFSQLR